MESNLQILIIINDDTGEHAMLDVKDDSA